MKNEFEDYIETITKAYGNVQQNHEGLSVRAIEVMKQASDKNKLFKNARSPYLTENGRQKITEYVYQSPLNNVNWRIECKSRIKPGLLGEILIELNYVANILENLYCLVLSDSLMNPNFLRLLETNIREKNLSHKVWVGSATQYINLLKSRVIM